MRGEILGNDVILSKVNARHSFGDENNIVNNNGHNLFVTSLKIIIWSYSDDKCDWLWEYYRSKKLYNLSTTCMKLCPLLLKIIFSWFALWYIFCSSVCAIDLFCSFCGIYMCIKKASFILGNRRWETNFYKNLRS